MSIAIIGATGHLGGLTIDALIERGTDPQQILALGRNTDRLAQLAGRGLPTAVIDFDQPDSLTTALAGASAVLLISGSAPGRRVAQHSNAITAAHSAGVQHLVYTSALQAPTTQLVLAPEHKATEELITAAGIPATFLRNGWYTENYQQDFTTGRDHGVIANSVGDGRIASAARRDYADAAAVVLTTPGHRGKAYELSGDTAWNYVEFAATATEVLGTDVRYQALTTEQEADQLRGAGLDEGTIGFITALNGNIRDDILAYRNGDLATLIGHPTTPLDSTMRSWV